MNPKSCFVVMPFTLKDVDKPRYLDVNHWSEVFEGLIVPALKLAGVSHERDDRDNGSRLIVQGLLEKIERSDLVLCDLSSHNPNVFLELGWALRADKPYVLIKDDLTEFTFDLAHQFTFQYDHRLQPTVLAREIERLANVVTDTILDTDRRYSVVTSIGISSAAISAASNGDFQTQLLLDIQSRLANVPDIAAPKLGQQAQFPWPELLTRGMQVLFSFVNQPVTVNSDSEEFRRIMHQRALELGAVANNELQLSVISNQRTFLYHDWPPEIGKSPRILGAEGRDIFDHVMNYPHGVVAWLDHGTHPPNKSRARPRANLGLFTTLPGSESRLFVEMHHEVPQ